MRKLITTLLILMSLCTTAAGESIMCKPGDVVNIRMKATTKSEVVGRFECGETIETDGVTKRDEKGRKWVHVVNAGLEVSEAWVCAMYVQSSEVTVERTDAYVSARGRTALRRSPNGKRIGWLKNGEKVTVLAYSNEWVLTTRGYVSMNCLDFYGGEI